MAVGSQPTAVGSGPTGGWWDPMGRECWCFGSEVSHLLQAAPTKPTVVRYQLCHGSVPVRCSTSTAICGDWEHLSWRSFLKHREAA